MESTDRPRSLARSEKTLPVGPARTAKLKCSYFALLIYFVYTILVLFSVITPCILSTRPFGAKSYGYNFEKGEYGIYFTSKLNMALVRSERIYKAAMVIETINAVLAIPVASAICARAAAVYSQQQKHSLTVRQAMELSNRDWLGSIK